MPDLPSRLALYSIGRDYVRQRSRKIDPALVDVEGSDVNIVVGSGSVVADHVVKHLLFRTAALTLEGAEDEELDRLAYDRYSLFRKGAAAAITTGVISRADLSGGAGTVPSGTRIASNTGVEYVTITDATFGIGDLTSRADIRASEAGKISQVAAGAIVRFVQPGDLFDKTLQITNPQAAAGGEDAEDDDRFKSRIRDFWRTARRGTKGAIEFGALGVPGVVSANAEEVLTSGGFPARLVNLYIADSSGVASDALADLVRVELEDFRACGIAVVISTSLPSYVEIQLRLRFAANVDTLALGNVVRAAVVAFVNSLPVNSPLYLGDLFSVLRRYVEDGLIPDRGSIVSPIGDLVPSVGTTIRTSLEQVVLV